MIQFVIAVCILYAIITWCIRSMKIRRDYSELSVVITGCDSGFGQELAYRLDRFRFNVYAACLTEEGAAVLDQTTSKKLRTAVVDIRKPDNISKLVKLVKETISNEKGLWAVVNNAGIAGPMGMCSLLKREDYLQCMDVNFFGMVEVTKQFLPLLRKSKGRIVNTSSVGGKFSSPVLQPYTVSKFCVEAFSDSLRRELYHEGVGVCVIEPGEFATKILSFAERDNVITNYRRTLEGGTEEDREYYGSDYPERVADAIQKQLSGSEARGSKNTYKVVNAYFHAITARFPKTRYVVGIDGKIILGLCWLFPEWILDFIISIVPMGSVKPAGLCK